jgi:hypothetical protein
MVERDFSMFPRCVNGNVSTMCIEGSQISACQGM